MVENGSSSEREAVGVGDSGENVRIVVRLLRLLMGRATQEGMAAAAKIEARTLGRYEKGTRSVKRPQLERLALAARVPMWAVEYILLPAVAAVRAIRTSAETLPEDDVRMLAHLSSKESPAVVAAAAEFLGIKDVDRRGDWMASSPLHIESAGDPWTLLPSRLSLSEAVAERYMDFEGVCLELCAESIRAAASDPARVLRLARLALRVAGLLPDPASRARLKAFALAFVANAQRILGDLAAAASGFCEVWRLWRQSEGCAGSQLAVWRLLDLEASLRRDQRLFSDALNLLDRALEEAPPESHGRILINKASVLEQGGRIAEAAAILEAAAYLIEARGESEELWMLRFNRGLLLWHLGQFSDAEKDLPGLHRQAVEAGYDLRVLRVKWLRARIWTGVGRLDEALTALEETRAELACRGRPGDAAIATLDLALLHLEAGRSAEVRTLASEAVLMFAALKVGPEAMSAIRLFQQAAEGESLTREIARDLLRRLEQARGASEPRISEHG